MEVLTMDAIQTFSIVSNSDQLSIACAVSTPTTTPRAIVQILHGMSEHKERYFDFMQFLSRNGFVAVIHDHRGHGASIHQSKDLGHFYGSGFQALIEDARQVTQWATQKHPGLPLFLMGHSMGSLIARAYTKRYDAALSGLIVCGSPSKNPATPAGLALVKLMTLFKGSRYQSALVQNLSTDSMGKVFGNDPTKAAWLNSDKNAVLAYEADPLCGFPFTLDGYQSLFELMIDVYRAKDWTVKNPSLPILFVSGKDDPCMIDQKTFMESIRLLYDIGYRSVTHKLYPGMRHEILNEPNKEAVYEDILQFINQSL